MSWGTAEGGTLTVLRGQLATSGAMYSIVPQKVYVRCVTFLANPKSMSLTKPATVCNGACNRMAQGWLSPRAFLLLA